MGLAKAVRLATWLLILSCSIAATAMPYSGGQGTVASPYVLSYKGDILELASRPEDFDKSFVLTADIDLDGAVFERPIIAPNIVFIPSFNEYKYFFSGYFNGNGHIIENFSLVGKRSLGFFGGIEWSGRVMHLGLKNVRVAGTSYVGMLAAINRGRIIGCFTQGQVAGEWGVGGLVGYQLDGCILDCFSQGSVDAASDGAGGLAGCAWEGRIERCYAACAVSSGKPSGRGGLIGTPYGAVRGGPDYVVSSSFWDVDVSGASASGGGLGLSTDAMHEVSTYTDAGWDFTQEQANGINDMWTCPDESGYPTLSAFSGVEPVWLARTGSYDDPYTIILPLFWTSR
jgi:hypothetical protein